MNTRRRFLRQIALSGAASALPTHPYAAGAPADRASFFVVGDTHYCAQSEDFGQMDATSVRYNAGLVRWLNQLPGTEFLHEAGGGIVAQPHGVIHCGDIIDNGDKGPSKYKMVETESAAFVADWGLNGGDGKLNWPVREVHGNHDAPRGDTPMIELIKQRNQRRSGLKSLSPNGLHYSWDWAGIHFVALGIVVGEVHDVTRKRRYAPLDSLDFLKRDLAENVGNSGRPVVLVHHIDAPRYSVAVPDEKVIHHEWDYADVAAYHTALKPYRIAALLCGHTHVRRIFKWNGTGDTQAEQGYPFLNTDNAAHFHSESQAFLHVEVTGRELLVREFATKDGWQTGTWTPQVWRFDLA
jgi:predicted phosphodiesterase